MKFRSITLEEKRKIKIEKLEAWHRWFAWTPIRLTVDNHEVRWMENVYRKGKLRHTDDGPYWQWKYADGAIDVIQIKEDR